MLRLARIPSCLGRCNQCYGLSSNSYPVFMLSRIHVCTMDTARGGCGYGDGTYRCSTIILFVHGEFCVYMGGSIPEYGVKGGRAWKRGWRVVLVGVRFALLCFSLFRRAGYLCSAVLLELYSFIQHLLCFAAKNLF